MAEIKIMGDACVLVSGVKLEEFEKVQKYRPEGLILYGGEDGKEPVFGVCVTKHGPGNISSVGVEFARSTNDDDKFACLTMVVNAPVADFKQEIMDRFGPALLKLNEVEEKIPEILEEIESEQETLGELITVVS